MRVKQVRIAPIRLCLIGFSFLAALSAAAKVEDPYFGEALYYAHQGHYFEALQRLDVEMAQHYQVDERQLDSFFGHIDHAEFSAGDFELRYRMHDRAGRAMRAVLAGEVDPAVRNDAAFRLARLFYQKNQLDDALETLESIRGPVPPNIRDDVELLRANIYLSKEKPKAAVDVLLRLQADADLRGFTAHNLGIALMRSGQQEDAIRQLDKAGRASATDQAARSIRDKSNLVLGTLLLEASEFDLAQLSLERVRLSGPFSNQALLRAGWAHLAAGRFERALPPWNALVERETTDPAVQEALLALPHAYSRLEVHGRAAVLYERAVRSFVDEIDKIDSSIASIREGEFLEALAREEIRQDRDWVVRLRALPDAPETFYLVDLIASHEFQTALQNYLDLEDLRRKLEIWQTDLTAYEDLIRLRRAYYEPSLPAVDERFRALDARLRLRLEQRTALGERLQQLLIAPRPEHLATAEEQRAMQRLYLLDAALAGASPEERAPLETRIARLRGVVQWKIATQYHDRLTRAHEHLRELDDEVDAVNVRYAAFVRARQAATHSYQGYAKLLQNLRVRVNGELERLGPLRARQGHMLEQVAIAELSLRRQRLESYQDRARFAFADSYDRAAKTQAQARAE